MPLLSAPVHDHLPEIGAQRATLRCEMAQFSAHLGPQGWQSVPRNAPSLLRDNTIPKNTMLLVSRDAGNRRVEAAAMWHPRSGLCTASRSIAHCVGAMQAILQQPADMNYTATELSKQALNWMAVVKLDHSNLVVFQAGMPGHLVLTCQEQPEVPPPTDTMADEAGAGGWPLGVLTQLEQQKQYVLQQIRDCDKQLTAGEQARQGLHPKVLAICRLLQSERQVTVEECAACADAATASAAGNQEQAGAGASAAAQPQDSTTAAPAAAGEGVDCGGGGGGAGGAAAAATSAPGTSMLLPGALRLAQGPAKTARPPEAPAGGAPAPPAAARGGAGGAHGASDQPPPPPHPPPSSSASLCAPLGAPRHVPLSGGAAMADALPSLPLAQLPSAHHPSAASSQPPGPGQLSQGTAGVELLLQSILYEASKLLKLPDLPLDVQKGLRSMAGAAATAQQQLQVAIQQQQQQQQQQQAQRQQVHVAIQVQQQQTQRQQVHVATQVQQQQQLQRQKVQMTTAEQQQQALRLQGHAATQLLQQLRQQQAQPQQLRVATQEQEQQQLEVAAQEQQQQQQAKCPQLLVAAQGQQQQQQQAQVATQEEQQQQVHVPLTTQQQQQVQQVQVPVTTQQQQQQQVPVTTQQQEQQQQQQAQQPRQQQPLQLPRLLRLGGLAGSAAGKQLAPRSAAPTPPAAAAAVPDGNKQQLQHEGTQPQPLAEPAAGGSPGATAAAAAAAGALGATAAATGPPGATAAPSPPGATADAGPEPVKEEEQQEPADEQGQQQQELEGSLSAASVAAAVAAAFASEALTATTACGTSTSATAEDGHAAAAVERGSSPSAAEAGGTGVVGPGPGTAAVAALNAALAYAPVSAEEAAAVAAVLVPVIHAAKAASAVNQAPVPFPLTAAVHAVTAAMGAAPLTAEKAAAVTAAPAPDALPREARVTAAVIAALARAAPTAGAAKTLFLAVSRAAPMAEKAAAAAAAASAAVSGPIFLGAEAVIGRLTEVARSASTAEAAADVIAGRVPDLLALEMIAGRALADAHAAPAAARPPPAAAAAGQTPAAPPGLADAAAIPDADPSLQQLRASLAELLLAYQAGELVSGPAAGSVPPAAAQVTPGLEGRLMPLGPPRSLAVADGSIWYCPPKHLQQRAPMSLYRGSWQGLQPGRVRKVDLLVVGPSGPQQQQQQGQPLHMAADMPGTWVVLGSTPGATLYCASSHDICLAFPGQLAGYLLLRAQLQEDRLLVYVVPTCFMQSAPAGKPAAVAASSTEPAAAALTAASATAAAAAGTRRISPPAAVAAAAHCSDVAKEPPSVDADVVMSFEEEDADLPSEQLASAAEILLGLSAAAPSFKQGRKGKGGAAGQVPRAPADNGSALEAQPAAAAAADGLGYRRRSTRPRVSIRWSDIDDSDGEGAADAGDVADELPSRPTSAAAGGGGRGGGSGLPRTAVRPGSATFKRMPIVLAGQSSSRPAKRARAWQAAAGGGSDSEGEDAAGDGWRAGGVRHVAPTAAAAAAAAGLNRAASGSELGGPVNSSGSRPPSAGPAIGDEKKYKGVTYDKAAGKWRSQMQCSNLVALGMRPRLSLGYFNSAEDAARLYDRVLLALKGPGAASSMNFPRSDYADEHIPDLTHATSYLQVHKGLVALGVRTPPSRLEHHQLQALASKPARAAAAAPLQTNMLAAALAKQLAQNITGGEAPNQLSSGAVVTQLPYAAHAYYAAAGSLGQGLASSAALGASLGAMAGPMALMAAYQQLPYQQLTPQQQHMRMLQQQLFVMQQQQEGAEAGDDGAVDSSGGEDTVSE